MRFGRLLVLLALVPPLAVPASGETAPAPLLTSKGARPRPAHNREARPAVVAIALRYLGVPYRWSGASPSGFDCSGFVMYVFSKAGVSLPHNAAMQYRLGRPISRQRLAPGDLVFFNGLSHAGIYIGRGRFVHSPHSGDVVKISRLSESWYGSTYFGARRLRYPVGR